MVIGGAGVFSFTQEEAWERKSKRVTFWMMGQGRVVVSREEGLFFLILFSGILDAEKTSSEVEVQGKREK